MATLLRFAGGLHLVRGQIVIEAELDTGSTARRLRKEIAEVYGHASDVHVVAPGGLRKGNRYVVRVSQGRRGAGPADRADRRPRPAGPRACRRRSSRGDLRRRGRLARRLPRARLADRAGPLHRRWRSPAPGPEAALALVGAARRLGVQAKAREVRGVDRVVVRDGDAIGVLLTRLGAHDSVLAWEERRMRREVRATANRLANFDDANLRRSARAAVAAGARVAAGAGDPRRGGARAPAAGRPAAGGARRPRWRSSARSPTRR